MLAAFVLLTANKSLTRQMLSPRLSSEHHECFRETVPV